MAAAAAETPGLAGLAPWLSTWWSKPMRPFNNKRGNAMLEFALSAAVLFALFSSTFQYGYTFYIYNELQGAVRNGARYASQRTYKASSSGCIDKTKDAIRYATVYGYPVLQAKDLPAGTPPSVRGLTIANVDVNYILDPSGVPFTVEVKIINFTVDALFSSYIFNNKPYAQAPFLGTYGPTLCD
jgi:hypothetical protein